MAGLLRLRIKPGPYSKRTSPRIKVLQPDWKYQVAQLGPEAWWVNKVGTYGMASAQLYWGRMAALLLRLTYMIFPNTLPSWNS